MVLKKSKRLNGRILVILALSLCLLMGCGPQKETEISSLSQLGKPNTTIGIGQGMPEWERLQKDYPDAKVLAYSDNIQAYTDVKNGVIDAYVNIRHLMECAIRNGTTGVRLLDENYSSNTVAVGLSPKSPIQGLQEKINTFLAQLKADGTLEDMYERWVVESDYTMPEIPIPKNPTLHLRVGTAGTVMPYTFYKEAELTGLDIELAYRFASWLGADVSFKIYNFSGLISAAATGDVDCIMSDLFYTAENREEIPFSDPLFQEEVTAMVREPKSPAAADTVPVPEFNVFYELNGKTVSMLTGAPFEELVLKHAPSVKEFTYFANVPDMLLALKSKKTDAALFNNAICALMVSRDSDIVSFPQELDSGSFGIAFAKDSPEREKWQAAYDTISEETKQKLWEKWTGSDEASKVLPAQDWPGKGGTVKAAVCDTMEPMSYASEGGVKGFDVEMILLMAKELDVHVEFIGMDFSAILPYIESGKAQLGAGSIIVTPERSQAVDFLEHYPAAYVLAVRATQKKITEDTFWGSIKSSFEKTFLREKRWQLFLSGIATTLLITVMSILFGVALGFIVFMLCRRGNPAVNKITDFFVWLINGLPGVVLLMILYYIIFGKVAISSTIVSIIGFTLVFGSAVFSMIRAGVSTVDYGQIEAARSLGFTDLRTLFRIILPQALPHIFPALKVQITMLIKSTAIVGYIAVQDLTKMGDIVRSRTYEPFFPLIAVAVIYFVLAGVLNFFVRRLEKRIDPKHRTREQIMKGVKTGD